MVVPLQGPADQILQLFILEDFEPLDVDDGIGLRRRQRVGRAKPSATGTLTFS